MPIDQGKLTKSEADELKTGLLKIFRKAMEKYDEGNHEQATFAAEAATALITLHNGSQDFKPD